MTDHLSQPAQARKSVDRLCDHTYIPSLLNPDSTVLDLGANRGYFSHGIISRFHCRVVALEPLSKLRVDIGVSPKLTLLPFAVGGRNERARLHVFDSRCASLLPQRVNEAMDEEEDIEVLDLRTVLVRSEIDKIDLMKVDIEGAELDMFVAALDADLCRCTQITVEFHDFLYPEQRRQVESIKRRLRSLGFWVINFSLDNTDVLFVNADSSGIGRLQYSKLKYITKYTHGISRRLRVWRGAACLA